MASIIKNSLSHQEHTKQGKTLETDQEIDRYKLNNLMSRYNSYRELWRRRLKVKGEEIY
jgi:benzoyl-CoA reductase/2-hydroxyglutaryl-CoA dehydratase subunit BcrC/BadD/HgdB